MQGTLLSKLPLENVSPALGLGRVVGLCAMIESNDRVVEYIIIIWQKNNIGVWMYGRYGVTCESVVDGCIILPLVSLVSEA